MTPLPPVLSVEGLSLSYDSPTGEVLALRDINLTIDHGQIVGLVGDKRLG